MIFSLYIREDILLGRVLVWNFVDFDVELTGHLWLYLKTSQVYITFGLQRRVLLQKRQSFGRGNRRPPLLEPASAEFISALAAGINSRHALQVGCGLSTLALAAGRNDVRLNNTVFFLGLFHNLCTFVIILRVLYISLYDEKKTVL